MSKIDYSKFEEKTRGGYDWEVIVPEDGLIRVINDGGDKVYLFINDNGSQPYTVGGKSISADYHPVLREEEWRAGWRPLIGQWFLTVTSNGAVNTFAFSTKGDARFASVGNCYPDTPRGKLLAEARAKYEPLIGEIAGMDEPEEVFKKLRVLNSGECVAGFNTLGRRLHEYRAAARWLDSGYRLTTEEAEA